MSPGSRVRVAAAAVPGCQHVLAGGTRCQDAARTFSEGGVTVLAVADGHGSKLYVHSDEGARTAVDVAVEVLAAVVPQLAAHPFAQDPDALLAEVGPTIRRRIAWEWNRRVQHHAAMCAVMDGGTWPDEIPGEWTSAVRPYGCTLLAAAFTAEHALWFRLGDGELLAVDEAGATRILPIPQKLSQETASLAMREATEHMRLALHSGGPRLAVLATDGVCDPYDVDPKFEDVWGAELLSRIEEHGWVAAMLALPRNLGALSRDGDDCTVAVAYREEG